MEFIIESVHFIKADSYVGFYGFYVLFILWCTPMFAEHFRSSFVYLTGNAMSLLKNYPVWYRVEFVYFHPVVYAENFNSETGVVGLPKLPTKPRTSGENQFWVTPEE